MNFRFIGFALVIFCMQNSQTALAQDQDKVLRSKGKMNQQFVMNNETVIINQATGQRINYHAYDELLKKNPGRYRTKPVFDKYGKASSFALIPKTKSEIETGITLTLDEDGMPEIGKPIPPFVMHGLDGKTYDSEKLKGKYVLLGFWVKYEKPLYTFESTKIISDFIEENRANGVEVVSLGTTINTDEECRKAIPKRNCGFIPVPDSYGFNHRYKVTETPFFILIDKKGIVRAMAPHTEFDKISTLSLR
jgi:peroxiredoxin